MIPGGFFKVGPVSVNPASIGAVASGDTAVTVQGVQTDMDVVALPPTDLDAGLALQAAWVSAQNQITVRLTNASAGAVDGAAKNWYFLIFTGSDIAHQAG
jgi:hypothetical protein